MSKIVDWFVVWNTKRRIDAEIEREAFFLADEMQDEANRAKDNREADILRTQAFEMLTTTIPDLNVWTALKYLGGFRYIRTHNGGPH